MCHRHLLLLRLLHLQDARRPSGSGNRLPAEDALVPLAEESAAEGEPKRRKLRHDWNRLQVMGDGVHIGDLVWNDEKNKAERTLFGPASCLWWQELPHGSNNRCKPRGARAACGTVGRVALDACL